MTTTVSPSRQSGFRVTIPLEVIAARAVIGRDNELAALKAFLADVERRPTALVLSGEAGIGKTILWEVGVDEAGAGYPYVLTSRGVEAEASLSFAGLSELLAPVFDEVADSLLPPRRRALEVALLRVEPGEAAPDAHLRSSRNWGDASGPRKHGPNWRGSAAALPPPRS